MSTESIDVIQGLDKTRVLDFSVEGMTCGSCAARVERTLAESHGVADAEVNFATGRAHVTLVDGAPGAVAGSNPVMGSMNLTISSEIALNRSH